MNSTAPDRQSVRRSATLLLVGQLLRSYQNLALGLALLLLAAAVGRTARLPRPIANLMGRSGLTYLA